MGINEQTKSLFKIKASGWKIILLRVKDQITENNVGIVSAGVAFYAFLAIFPALMALISIYGLAMDPENVQRQISSLSDMIPEQAFSIVEGQIKEFTSTSGKALSWGTVLGILFSLWSANKGTKSLFTGVDIAYDTNNTRNFIWQNALTLLFTFGAILILILSMVLIVIFPALVDQSTWFACTNRKPYYLVKMGDSCGASGIFSLSDIQVRSRQAQSFLTNGFPRFTGGHPNMAGSLLGLFLLCEQLWKLRESLRLHIGCGYPDALVAAYHLDGTIRCRTEF